MEIDPQFYYKSWCLERTRGWVQKPVTVDDQRRAFRHRSPPAYVKHESSAPKMNRQTKPAPLDTSELLDANDFLL